MSPKLTSCFVSGKFWQSQAKILQSQAKLLPRVRFKLTLGKQTSISRFGQRLRKPSKKMIAVIQPLADFNKRFAVVKVQGGMGYPHVEKTDNAPRKNTFPSSSSWLSVGVGVLFTSSFHTHSQRGCVWKGEEKKHLTPALGQEWREGNVFFLGALSVFSIRWYL